MLCQCDNNGRYTKTNFRQKKVPDRLKLCGKNFRRLNFSANFENYQKKIKYSQ